MIAITGGAGFIGSVLARKFNELGRDDVLIVDQDAEHSPKRANLQGLRHSAYLDSDAFLEQLENGGLQGKLSALFHMGACSDTTETDRDYLRKNNTEYSMRLAEWAIKNSCYFAYASSAATYGDGALGFSDDDSLTPRLRPLNGYGQSKLDFDIWVLKNSHQNRITGFRFFNVYGPNEYHKAQMRSLVHKGFEQIRGEGKLSLFKSYKKEYADGGQKRDFVYVKDVVDAMIWFYENPSKKGIFNLGSGKAQSWNELADALFGALRLPKNVEFIEMPLSIRNQYQYFTEADMKKLRAAGCPTKFRNLEQGIGDYVRNYLLKENPYL